MSIYSIGGPGDYSAAPYIAEERKADEAQRIRESIVEDFERLRRIVWRFFEDTPDKAKQIVVRHILANVDICDDGDELSQALSELVDEEVIKEMEAWDV